MTVLMRVLCLLVLGAGAWIAYSVVRYSLPQSDIDRALNHPRDGEPRAVVCPMHGHLLTVYRQRDYEFEKQLHDIAYHEKSSL